MVYMLQIQATDLCASWSVTVLVHLLCGFCFSILVSHLYVMVKNCTSPVVQQHFICGPGTRGEGLPADLFNVSVFATNFMLSH